VNFTKFNQKFSFQLAKLRTPEQFKAFNDSMVCRNLSTIETHPLDCCKYYPRHYDAHKEIAKECSQYCRSIPYPEFSCLRFCILKMNGIVKKDRDADKVVFIPSGLNNCFIRHQRQNSDQAGCALEKNWSDVVKKSIEHCQLFFMKDVNTSKEEEADYHVKMTVDCVYIQNFINCPNEYWTKGNKDCDRLKAGMVLCSPDNYGVTHGLFFEDFYDRKHPEIMERFDGTSPAWTGLNPAIGR
jgi:hypothetical protein